MNCPAYLLPKNTLAIYPNFFKSTIPAMAPLTRLGSKNDSRKVPPTTKTPGKESVFRSDLNPNSDTIPPPSEPQTSLDSDQEATPGSPQAPAFSSHHPSVTEPEYVEPPDQDSPKPKPSTRSEPEATNKPALTDPTNAADHLLALRKAYKRMAGLFHKTRGHLNFLRDCHNKRTIPRGLQLKIPCMAAAQARTNIALNFDEITSTAERTLLEALIEHYQIVTDQASEELEETQLEMARTVARADRLTTLRHSDLMKLTDANLLKKEAKRHTRGREKTRKLLGPNPNHKSTIPPPPLPPRDRPARERKQREDRPHHSRPAREDRLHHPKPAFNRPPREERPHYSKPPFRRPPRDFQRRDRPAQKVSTTHMPHPTLHSHEPQANTNTHHKHHSRTYTPHSSASGGPLGPLLLPCETSHALQHHPHTTPIHPQTAHPQAQPNPTPPPHSPHPQISTQTRPPHPNPDNYNHHLISELTKTLKTLFPHGLDGPPQPINIEQPPKEINTEPPSQTNSDPPKPSNNPPKPSNNFPHQGLKRSHLEPSGEIKGFP